MLFRQAIRKTFSGVRHQSTSAKAKDAAANLLENIQNYVSKTVYWSKVSAELGKQVWLKEKLSPPSLHEIQSVYQTIYTQGFYYAQRPNEFLAILKGLNKNHFANTGAYLVQFAGLFAFGEAIGRRNLIRYPSFESHHH